MHFRYQVWEKSSKNRVFCAVFKPIFGESLIYVIKQMKRLQSLNIGTFKFLGGKKFYTDTYIKIDTMKNTDFDFNLALLEVYVFLGYLYYVVGKNGLKTPKMPKNTPK